MSDREIIAAASHRVPWRNTWLLSLGLASLLGLVSCSDERPETTGLALSAPSDTTLITGSLPGSQPRGLQRKGIFIQLPAGLPDELASQLLARFQEASIANQLTLARTGTVPELTVKGVARAGTAANGTAIALVWEVLGPTGKRLKRISSDAFVERPNSAVLSLVDPWATVDEATLELIADTAALELATWVSDRSLGVDPDGDATLTTASIRQAGNPAPPAQPAIDFSTPSILQQHQHADVQTEALSDVAARNATLGQQTPQPVQSRPAPMAVVPTPEPIMPPAQIASPERIESPSANLGSSRALFDVAVGTSPGDGRLSLAAAVQEALVDAHYEIAKPQAFRIIGNVALETNEPGTMPGAINVRIEWTISTKDGTPLGLVTQSNEVEASAIASTWGEIAIAAGSAAADGILQLINQPTPPA